jgi:hypothetical protein
MKGDKLFTRICYTADTGVDWLCYSCIGFGNYFIVTQAQVAQSNEVELR